MVFVSWIWDKVKDVCTSAGQVEAALPEVQRTAFRRLLTVVPPPRDIPGLQLVASSLSSAVSSYLRTLHKPSAEAIAACNAVESLSIHVSKIELAPYSRQAMFRRLTSSIRLERYGAQRKCPGSMRPVIGWHCLKSNTLHRRTKRVDVKCVEPAVNLSD